MTDASASTASKGARGPFSPLAMTWIILVGVVAALALALLAAFGPQLKRGDNGRGHVFSHSAIGFAALARLVEVGYGPPIIMRESRDSPAGLIIVTPNAEHDLKAALNVKSPGRKLVVLPKWQTRPDPRRPQWVLTTGVESTDTLRARFLTPLSRGTRLERRSETPVTPDLRFGPGHVMHGAPITRLQTFKGPGWKAVVTDGQGGIILGCIEETCVLSDPDFLNTQGLRTLPAARVAMAMIASVSETGPLVIDATLHNFGVRPNVLRLLFEPNLLGPSLCLCALAGLLVAHAAVRFGPPLIAGRAIAFGKAALADNTAGLMRRAGREHRMLVRYALIQRDAVAAGVGAPRDLDDEGLTAQLDRLSDAAGAQRFSSLFDQARAVGPKGDLLGVADSLFQWRTEMMRER